MTRLIHVLLVVAALAILAHPFGLAFDSVYGADVHLLSAVNDPDTVETNRALYFPDESASADEQARAVIDIYGSNPTLDTERVLLLDDSRVMRPEEMPALALLPAGSAGGEYPTQTQSVLYVTQTITLGGFVGAVVLLLARRLTRGGG